MKQWFPLTDYDFYGFVASGMLLIAAIDYSVAGAVLVSRSEWSVAQGVFWVIIAYFVGQICAAPSSAILEHLVVRRWLTVPADIQLGLKQRNWIEYVLATMFAPREYGPLSEPVRAVALERAAAHYNRPVGSLDGEAVYQAAFHVSRAVPDTATRLNTFINQYGLGRNVAFVGILAIGLLTYRQIDRPTTTGAWLIVAAVALSIGMFGRFFKFYAAYSSDVLRTYASQAVTP